MFNAKYQLRIKELEEELKNLKSEISLERFWFKHPYINFFFNDELYNEDDNILERKTHCNSDNYRLRRYSYEDRKLILEEVFEHTGESIFKSEERDYTYKGEIEIIRESYYDSDGEPYSHSYQESLRKDNIVETYYRKGEYEYNIVETYDDNNRMIEYFRTGDFGQLKEVNKYDEDKILESVQYKLVEDSEKEFKTSNRTKYYYNTENVLTRKITVFFDTSETQMYLLIQNEKDLEEVLKSLCEDEEIGITNLELTYLRFICKLFLDKDVICEFESNSFTITRKTKIHHHAHSTTGL